MYAPTRESALSTLPPMIPARCIRGVGRRRLSPACIEGILASSGSYAAMMDADFPPDQLPLPTMLSLLQSVNLEDRLDASTLTN
jgi:hypothetical protein